MKIKITLKPAQIQTKGAEHIAWIPNRAPQWDAK